MRTILVVDDIPMMRELGALFLSRLGRVLTATNGAEALEISRRERPDVILVDLLMPALDGPSVCKQVKSDPELEQTPVLVLLGSDRAEDRERAIRAGADDVLPKPIERAELLETVQRFFRSPTPLAQPRVEIEAPVRLRQEESESWGTARNLSRGGVFVECSAVPAPRSELSLEMPLPGTTNHLSSTALVVWKREPTPVLQPGVGLRFLALDGQSARSLATYLQEYPPITRSPLETPV
jgi:uncharacterized protein (TIGR02266 family)